MPHKTVYRLTTFGDVTGPLAASGKAILPCTVVWDDGAGFDCADEEDIRAIVSAVAKEKSFQYDPDAVAAYLLNPVMTGTEVQSGQRQSSVDDAWLLF